MKRLFKLLVPVTAIIFLICQVPASAEVNYPEYDREKGYVNDFAGVLSEEAEVKIMEMGRELENKTTAQVTAVTIQSLDGIDIKTYANELFEKWGVGQAGKDNGVLILNAVDEREVWIEVGYGLNPVLGAIRVTDYFDNYMVPHLRNGDYDSAFLEVYAALAARIAEEEGVDLDTGIDPQPEEPYEEPYSQRRDSFNYGAVIFVILLALDGTLNRFRVTSTLLKIIFWSSFFRGGGGRGGRGGGGWGGGGFGGGRGGGWGGGSGGGGFGGFGGGSSGGGGGGGKY